jgi:hypothetical protein
MIGFRSADLGELANAGLAGTCADPDREAIVDCGGFWEVDSELHPAIGVGIALHEREGR